MLKRKALNRIFFTTIAIFIVLVVYTITNKLDKNDVFNEKLNINKTILYTINNDNYVSKAEIYVDDKLKPLEKIKEVLEVMIEKNNKNILLPSYFKPILPQNTKVNDIKLENNIIKVYFSKELLNISKSSEEALIESIIYTLTSFEDIIGIEIYVNNDLLRYLPNSNKQLPTMLTRDYGINKVIDIYDTNDITKVILYYVSNYENNYYYIPITKYMNNSNKSKFEIIVEELSNNYIFENNLISFLNIDTKVNNYSIKNDSMTINLETNSNDDIIIEPFILSIFDNFNIDNIKMYINEEILLEKSRKNIEY